MKAKVNITELFFELKNKEQKATFDRGLFILGIHSKELKPAVAKCPAEKVGALKAGKL